MRDLLNIWSRELNSEIMKLVVIMFVARNREHFTGPAVFDDSLALKFKGANVTQTWSRLFMPPQGNGNKSAVGIKKITSLHCKKCKIFNVTPQIKPISN